MTLPESQTYSLELISRIYQPLNYLFLTINQPTLISVMAYQPNEVGCSMEVGQQECLPHGGRDQLGGVGNEEVNRRKRREWD